MVAILLAVFTSVLLLIIFKLFPKAGVNTPIAIIYNYATAAITGAIFLGHTFSFSSIFNAPWISLSIPLGVLFIAVFYFMSSTAQRISLSTTSVANKMSVAMPVLFSVIFLHQPLTALKIIGIVIALVAVYLSSKSNSPEQTIKNLWWLPLTVFIGSGLIDISINAVNAYYVRSYSDSALFSITTFAAAFCTGMLVVLFLLLAKKITVKQFLAPKNIIGGIILGIPNYFSIYFIFLSLESKLLNSSQLFPVLNLSNVVLAAISGSVLFKEKLSITNIIGIALAILSIILISL